MSTMSVVSYVASGNITPARFVAIVTGGNDFVVQQATTGSVLAGIAENATYYAPGTPADSGYAGVNGLTLRIFGPGEEGLLEVGAAVSAGDYLVTDSVGRGITAVLTATAHQDIGAVALQTAASSGTKIRVQVVRLPARQT